MITTRVGVFFYILCLLLTICCSDERESFTITPQGEVLPSGDLCEEGQGIVFLAHPVLEVFGTEICRERFHTNSSFHNNYLKGLAHICTGRLKCLPPNTLATLVESCVGHPLPANVTTRHSCKPVVQDSTSVFNIATDPIQKYFHNRCVYLVMNLTKDVTMHLSCHLDAVKISVDLLSLQFLSPEGARDCEEAMSVSYESQRRNIYCSSNISYIHKQLLKDFEGPLKLQVSMKSGFLWLELKDFRGSIRCENQTSIPTNTMKPGTGTTRSRQKPTTPEGQTFTGTVSPTSVQENLTLDESEGRNWINIVIAVSVGACIFILVSAGLLVFLCRRRRNSKRQKRVVESTTREVIEDYTYIDDSKVLSPAAATKSNNKSAETFEDGGAAYSECGPDTLICAPQEHYSTAGLNKSKSAVTQGTPYDAIETLRGEYGRLKRPGEHEKIFTNVYDG